MRAAVLAVVLFAAVAFGSKNPFEGSNVAPLSGISEFTAVMRSQSEASVFFIYDSADVNCLRTIPQFTKAAAPLRGFASFYAIDIRDATVNWALDAWNVQILPAVRGASSHRTKRPGFEKAGLSARVAGTRQVVEMQIDRGLSEASLKRFALSMQGETPIVRVESDKAAEDLYATVTSKRSVPAVVLLSNKPTSSQLFKAVSISLSGRCDAFDVYTGKAKHAQKQFGVDKLPKLLVFDAEGTEHEYSGALTPTDIVSFVDGFAADRATHSRMVLAEESAALAQVSSGN
jgi:hypothetical protein